MVYDLNSDTIYNAAQFFWSIKLHITKMCVITSFSNERNTRLLMQNLVSQSLSKLNVKRIFKKYYLT